MQNQHVIPNMAVRGRHFSSFASTFNYTGFSFLLPILPASWSWIFSISIGVVTITYGNTKKVSGNGFNCKTVNMN